MYNAERKKKFLDDYSKSNATRNYSERILEVFEKYERDVWHEDVCMQPEHILSPIINSQTGTRSRSAERVLVVLKEYVRWCKRNGLPTSDGVFGVKVNVIEAIKEQMVSTPDMLYHKLERVFHGDPDNETVNCLYKAYFWMAYAGLRDVEALDVRVSDVDLNDMVIRYNDHVYQLYLQARKTFKAARELTEFKHYHPNYISNKVHPRHEGDKLIRGFKSDSMTLKTMRGIVTRRSANCNEKLSYKKIYYSGLFYRTYERELSGIKPSFSDEVSELFARAAIENARTGGSKYQNRLTYAALEIARSLEIDYESWKCAFA